VQDMSVKMQLSDIYLNKMEKMFLNTISLEILLAKLEFVILLSNHYMQENKFDPIQSGQRRPNKSPTAHRTVRTGPYTAPHVTLIHL
jgi:hypothetical protein